MKKQTEIKVIRDLLDLREAAERERKHGNTEPMLTLTINTLNAILGRIRTDCCDADQCVQSVEVFISP